MASRTWYISCSPRSPEKIVPELELLSSFDGVFWNERDEDNQQIHQIKFAMQLKTLPSFEGRVSLNDPAFSARDRTAPMKTFGFVYVDGSGSLRITPAGWRLIEGVRMQEVFLKQLLKWQYPSWQHGGNSRTRHNYPPAEAMNIFPFVETLRVCHELDGLSKDEIAIFLLPVFHRSQINEAIDKIRRYRRLKNNLRGSDRFNFIKETHLNEFIEVYAEDLKEGKYSTRESITSTAEDFLKKKMRNSVDVSDAVIRYFRASGLFTISADYRRLVVSPLYRREVARILNEMCFEIVDFYDDVDRFYEYIGNPDIPTLPGLEFPLVIVDVGSDFREEHHAHAFKRFPKNGGKTCNMEDELRLFSPLGRPQRAALDRAFDDLIRHYFVAYSRAQDVLLLVGLNSVKDGYQTGSGRRYISSIATGWDRNRNWHWRSGLSNLIHI